MFGLHLIRSGEIESMWSSNLGESLDDRLAADYDANADFKLSATKPFGWRRNLPPLIAERTVFNYVATYNDFERRFAQFLDIAPDVWRFASLGTTEQGDSNSQFRVDYLKPSGAIGFYHPDWMVVQKTPQGEVSWIVETKGRIWEGTEAKDAAMRDWCVRVTQQTDQQWKYARVNQADFIHECHEPWPRPYRA
jgi:type III restriction enzyme